MSKHSKVLKIQRGNTTYNCDLYTTTAEANGYNGSNLKFSVGGTALYAPLFPTNYSQTFYDSYGTPVRVKNSENVEYVLAKNSIFRIAVTAVAHETITVTAGSTSWTSGNKWFPYGTKWTAKVVPETGWTAGAITGGTSGTLTNVHVAISAKAPTHNKFKLTLAATSHQTVTMQYRDYNGTSYGAWQTVTSGSSAKSYELGHNSEYKVTKVAADTGWTAGSPNKTINTVYKLTAAATVSVGAATHKTFVLTLAGTEHQTIKFQYRNYNGTSYGSWSSVISSGSSDKKYTLGHNSQYKVTDFTASTGYTTGTLNVTKGTTYTLTAAKTISATAATAITPTITIKRTDLASDVPYIKVTYTNTSGTSTSVSYKTVGSSTFKIKYNTKVKITNDDTHSYYLHDVYQGSTFKTTLKVDESWTSGALTSKVTFEVKGRKDSYDRDGNYIHEDDGGGA